MAFISIIAVAKIDVNPQDILLLSLGGKAIYSPYTVLYFREERE